MTDDDLILEAAKTLKRVPFSFVGPENARKMLRKIQEGETPEAIVGSEAGRLNTDFAGAALLLGAVILQLKTILEVIKLLKEIFGNRKPTVEEVKEKIPAKSDTLTDDEIIKAIEILLRNG